MTAGAICFGVLIGDALAQTELSIPKNSPGAAIPAQNEAEATALRPDWSVNCTTVQTELTCVASQAFFVKETGQRFMTVSVNPPNADRKTTLVLQLPLGIYLPAGVSLQFGEAETKRIQIIACDQAGCMADYTATNKEVKAMLNGENLQVAVQTRERKPLSVTVPFVGFDAAYTKLR